MCDTRPYIIITDDWLYYYMNVMKLCVCVCVFDVWCGDDDHCKLNRFKYSVNITAWLSNPIAFENSFIMPIEK